MKIKAITLNHFRGATRPLTIPFDVRKKFTLIYGENGTGKSSIVDALEFLFDQKRNPAFLSVNSTSATPEVKITDEDGHEYTTGSTIPEKVAILRRSFMSDLCNKKPADFYEFFQEIFPKICCCKGGSITDCSLRMHFFCMRDKFFRSLYRKSGTDR